MIEKGFFSQHMKNLPFEILANISRIYSHKVTEAEAKLLFEINARHCDNSFGRNESFVRDLLIPADEFQNYFGFLQLCVDKITLKKSNTNDRCGFIRINGSSDVPYVSIENSKYLPIFYFEGEIGSITRREIRGWDWAHLKLCCKVQGVREDVLPGDACPVLPLAELRDQFPAGTTFEEYWPTMDFLNKVFSKRSSQPGSWTTVVLNFGAKYSGKLIALKDFPVQPTGEQPYKAEKALIEKKKIQGVNTRPYEYREMLVTLPHLVEQLFPRFSEQQVGEVLAGRGVALYSGNTGHRDVIRAQGWGDKYEALPLVTVKDLVNNLQAIKNCLVSDSGGVKRFRGGL